MIRWEYRHVEITSYIERSTLQAMTALGAEGWEFAWAHEKFGERHLYFKRPATEQASVAEKKP